MTQNNFILPQKSELVQIKTSDIEVELPELKNINESKAVVIGKWLINWIKHDLACGKIKVNSLLPSKANLAYFLGVSVGTIQNAVRYVEDSGVVCSKQCIGTIIIAQSECGVRKLTSKRETAIRDIQNYIIHKNFKTGQNLPSSRNIAAAIGCSANTARLALEYLCTAGILEHKFKNSKDAGWVLKSCNFETTSKSENVSHRTLVSKVENDLKNYIDSNFRPGDKLPAHCELSAILKVSIKTIHDALKSLIDDGILLPRRGRYGTTVLRLPSAGNMNKERKETSIFASAQDTAFYYYEKTQNHIKKMISENYEIGSKLPSIEELSKEMELSPNTIRKAFQNLAKEGYLAFSRGRYGGTFVIDIPETGEEAFKWLAVNPKYAEMYKN